MSKNVFVLLFALLLLTGLCIFSYGILSVIGSTSAQGNSSWLGFGIGFLVVGGVLLYFSGSGLIKNLKQTPPSTTQVNIDLPGSVSIKEMRCKSCGGTINSSNIELQNNVAMVVCPWCDAHYQLSEEPKW